MYQFYLKYIAPPTGEPHNRIFSPEHLILTGLLTLMILYFFHKSVKENSQSYSTNLLRKTAWAMLFLEIFRISWNWFYHGFSLTIFRFDYCNQICMIMPLFILIGGKRFYGYFQELAFLGGVTVLIYPLWVFYDYGGIHLMAVQSMLSHALMVQSALLMPMASGQIPEVRKVYQSWISFGIMCTIAYSVSRITGVNYLLMENADGIPFISSIPFPYYWILLVPLFLAGTALFQKVWGLFYRKVLHLNTDSYQIYKRNLTGSSIG